MTGTLINVASVIILSVLGTLIGDRLPDRFRQTVMAGLGLVTMLIGVQMALKTQHLLIVLGSVVIGGIIGEALNIDLGLERLGRWLEARVARFGVPASDPAATTGPSFTRGFVTASLLFCVGPMAIIGSFQDGLTGDYQTLAVKSMLDGFASIAFASSLGIGVAFSALSVFFYQGALTLGAGWVKGLLTDPMITEMTATGGLLVVGIALGLLNLKSMRVANLLPSIFLAPVAVAFLGAWL